MSAVGTRSTFGKMRMPHTETLPESNAENALELDISDDLAAQLTVYVSKEFYWTIAENLVTGNTNIADNTKRGRCAPGIFNFGIAGLKQKFYIKAATEMLPINEAVSWWVSEED